MWPYFVDPFTQKCVSYGIFEVSQDKIVVDESQLYFDVRISRNHFAEVDKFTRSLGEYTIGDQGNETIQYD